MALTAVALVVLVVAPAASAQSETGVRDPFVPLIAPSPVATGTDPTVPVDPGAPVVPTPDPDEPLPGTGSETSSWVGLGYVLVALGSGAVALSRIFGPPGSRRADRRAIRGIAAPLQ